MKNESAFGGADTFKFYFPDYGPFSDATFTVLKVLEVLAKQNAPLSQLVGPFPVDWSCCKNNYDTSDKWPMFDEDLKRKLRTMQAEDFDYQDVILGMKIVYRDQGDIALIPSLTDETVGLIAEGKESVDPEELIARVEQIINEKCMNHLNKF